MAKKNRNYWRDRAEEHKKIVDKDTEQVIRETREAYERSLHQIDGEIARWYQRFADAEEITVEEARQQMTAGELNRYRMTLEEYIARGEQLDLDSSWATALEKASALHHIDRYDALRTIIRAEIEELKAKTRGTSWMDMIAEDAYNHMIYALSREAGLAIGFNQPAIDRLKMLIKSPWAPDGIDFARRVDMNMDKLAAEITKKLQQAFVTGQTYRELAADIEKTVGLKQYEAERIIRTESTQISSHAEQAAYNTAGIEQYEILVTLDDRTCELCGLMDKTVEDVEKMEPGVNAPPFHPNCRCTTVGHYDDGIDETRIARDEDGKPIHVDGNMTWKEWQKQYRGRNNNADIEMTALSRIYVGAEDKLKDRLEMVKPYKDFEDFGFHGDSKSVLYYLADGTETSYSAKEFADMLRNDPEYHGGKIRLLACNAGEGENSLAQQLAIEMNVVVRAPTEALFVDDDGNLFITNSDVLAEMWYNGTNVKETGRWKEFYP